MTTVLVAGGTGMLGSRIADYLVKETGVQVRLLVRDGWEGDDAKRQRVDPLVTQGRARTRGSAVSVTATAIAADLVWPTVAWKQFTTRGRFRSSGRRWPCRS
jgi:nucleoside-diphosphate-sugar epimerase